MMKQDTIHIKKLAIGYTGKGNVKTVAENIDATIHSGELTCLLGANGVGKSTLLRTLSGFQHPLGGEIKIMGKRLEDYTDKELATVIGVVLTERCDLRNMTAEELVGMGRSPYTGFWGRLGKTDRKVVDEAIGMVRIEDLRNNMMHRLSDGERQKVMIAKALAQETPVIFLDEPTAFLDYPSKVEIMQLLQRLSRTMNKTIFLSTHDLELALQIADKIWLMDRQKGVTIGTPEDLSLDGHLSGFFIRKGISFDMGSGLFRIENEFHRKIRLTGNGNRYTMAKKALQRNGIQADAGCSSDCWIDAGGVNSESFTVHTPDNHTVSVRNIEEMLQIVTNPVSENQRR